MAETLLYAIQPELIALGMQGGNRYNQVNGEAQEEGYVLHIESGLAANLFTFSVVQHLWYIYISERRRSVSRKMACIHRIGFVP